MTSKKRKANHNLRKARKRMGLTHDEIRIALKIKSARRISEWETGDSLPGIKHLLKLSVLLKTLPAQLFYDLHVEAVRDIQEWQKNRSPKGKRREKPP